MKQPSYVVITPVRNEAAYVGVTIDSMSAQTVPPQQWVIVDDGSTDGTGEILETSAETRPWIRVVRRPDRGYRKSGGGVVEAFYDGYRALRDESWDFLVKLDGDLLLESGYFESCLAHFARDPRLGIGGGTVFVTGDGRFRVDSPGAPPFHVRGATKIYRRECWKEVHPLLAGPGWDTIDEVKANMHGWRTMTFADVPLVQQRPTGAIDGKWSNWFKNGVANYATGYHPAFMFFKCLKKAPTKPFLVAALGLLAGYCSGYLQHRPRVVDATLIRYLRQQQVRCLMFRRSIYQPRRAFPWDLSGSSEPR